MVLGKLTQLHGCGYFEGIMKLFWVVLGVILSMLYLAIPFLTLLVVRLCFLMLFIIAYSKQ